MERCGRALKVYKVGVRMWPTDGGDDVVIEEFVADGEEGHEKVLLDSRTIYVREGRHFEKTKKATYLKYTKSYLPPSLPLAFHLSNKD